MTDLDNCRHELQKACDIIKRASLFYSVLGESDDLVIPHKEILLDCGLKFEKGRLKLNVLKDKL